MTNKEFLKQLYLSWQRQYQSAGSPTTDKGVKKAWNQWKRSFEYKAQKQAHQKNKN